MNELVKVELEEVDDLPQLDEPAVDQPWMLQKLKPRHMQICALLAQGFKNIEVASAVGVTKEYVSMLLRQPLIVKEVQRLAEVAGTRLEALTVQSVDVIADAMQNGAYKDKLQAARLQLEATKRIGRPDPMRGAADVDANRLVTLSERLVDLLRAQKGNVYEGTATKI